MIFMICLLKTQGRKIGNDPHALMNTLVFVQLLTFLGDRFRYGLTFSVTRYIRFLIIKKFRIQSIIRQNKQ